MISKKKANAAYWFFDAELHPIIAFSKYPIINGGPHNSGWGIGWLQNKNWEIFKQGKDSVKRCRFDKIKKVKSNIILIHLRRASSADNTTKNSHPFKYQNWIFEHNGGIRKKEAIKYLKDNLRKQLTSEMGSEVYFFLIMQFLKETGDIFKAIKRILKIVKKHPYSGLNFILSDGKKIYAFRDVNPKYKEKFGYYCLHYLIQPDKVVISSDPLTNEKWIPLKLRDILVVDSDLKVKLRKA